MPAPDVERGREIAKVLHEAFRTVGIHGKKNMPEDLLPSGVERGSLEHLLFVTLTVAIDYQREANELWKCSRQSFADPETAYLFSPARLHEVSYQQVRSDLQKHSLSKKLDKDCYIWRTVGITFHKKWHGDPRAFLEDCGWDALTILERLKAATHLDNGKQVLDFPYLRGPKIGPLWLRMLRDDVGLQIENLEAVPIPVDVHVARASLALGLVRGEYEGNVEGIYKDIRKAWRESVRRVPLDRREMIALDLDEPLWHLSKYGCTHRDTVTGECKHYQQCVAKTFCVLGQVLVTNSRVLLKT